MKFLRWFDAFIGNKKRKALLFLDRCPAHPLDGGEKLRFVRLCFFPPNCTSILQPLDRGIIKCVKGYFRQDLIRKAVSLVDDGKFSGNFKIDVLQALFYLRNAWNRVSAETIQNCFRSAGFGTPHTDDNNP